MKRTTQPDPNLLGRFDQSFFVRTMISFFVFTLVVGVIEIGIRYSVLLYEFHVHDREKAQTQAERLATDIQAIMLNRGGPIASRTVYPILKRDLKLAGLEIAVLPSHVTVTSIDSLFKFRPEGIPAEWPKGSFHEGRVEIVAEEFCLTCHVSAKPGDVLGTVYVRDYLDARLERWWEEVRLTGAISIVNILLHSVILFFLLRVLMGPLLSLRSAVSQLAKGARGLRTRAEVKSNDEFGELANDLNLFLDRAENILSDLRGMLGKMISVNDRLANSTARAQKRVATVEAALESTIPSVGEDTVGSANIVANDLDEMDSIIVEIRKNMADETSHDVSHKELVRLCQVVSELRGDWDRYQRQMAGMPRLIHEVHELRHRVNEVALLEEQLRDVADSGRTILDRLVGEGRGQTADGRS